MASNPAHLEPSKLGTKEYWSTLYTTELTNNASNPDDRGTVWFDDSDAESKLLTYLEDLTESAPFDHSLRQSDASFLDLGCGNGSLLFALRDEGWAGRALGVDYAPQSVELARRIAAQRQRHPDEENEDMADAGAEGEEREDEEEAKEPEFREWDVLNGLWETVLNGAQTQGWDVVLDKGTFDAICLSDEKDARGRRICEGYRGRALRLVRPGGLLLITSCNWTEEELRAWFEGPANEGDTGHFVAVGKVDYPSFTFGGAKGQTISSLCFQRQA
ncbi:S-adenosylmethionine-dependentmethyltransferase [Colletotrichum higginsianum IMI 349063]|uniref:Protein-lysine N-methyltransferase EFM4 n=1 Tax=Colletotrichum higginsianum (strain IMI 349063) TaxID=759273 RepID=A0A1B7YPX3_COLHI|nr:S-adenosylmethionine-dependentmethyltransferase [Colletotrichum higginsianum IMI 349063]OBR14073.1 S-adenosylmethionine-dependentmethyltransferase [Colletotrichum higginsianum IMI 349063]GJC95267.1 S-adenosylmethionine-dependentmethyltransferase [Colletotrichum higginsianum]